LLAGFGMDAVKNSFACAWLAFGREPDGLLEVPCRPAGASQELLGASYPLIGG
jgi:hypothetical protein